MSERKTLYAPAAETYGLVLRSHQREKKTPARDAMHKQYINTLKQSLMALFKKNEYGMYLQIWSKVAPKVQAEPSMHILDRTIITTVFSILGAVRVSHGEYTHLCLDLVYYASEDIEDVFTQLRPMLFRVLSDADVNAHGAAMRIIHRILKILTADQIAQVVPELCARFPRHPSEQFRSIFYTSLIWIYENHDVFMDRPDRSLERKSGAGRIIGSSGTGSNSASIGDYKMDMSGDSSSAGAVISNSAAVVTARSKLMTALIQGLSDDDPTIRERMYTFWDHEQRLDPDVGRRLVQVLQDMYDTETEDQWLHYATYLLMHPMRRSSDWLRPFSEKPLAETSKFESTWLIMSATCVFCCSFVLVVWCVVQRLRSTPIIPSVLPRCNRRGVLTTRRKYRTVSR